MINIHNLAGRIASLYYDYDYYDFNDSLEVGETMEDAIFKIERVLSGKGGVDSYIDFMDEIIDNIEWEQTEDPSDPNYGEDMLNRAMDIRDDLYSLKDGLQEDTVKQGNGWVNKGKEGTHGKFKTKKAADAQRKAMFANGFKEDVNMKRRMNEDNDFYVGWHKTNAPELKKWLGNNKHHNFYRKDNGKWYLGKGRDDAYEMEVAPDTVDTLRRDKFFANRTNESYKRRIRESMDDYDVNEIAKWIERTVRWLVSEDCGMGTYDLGRGLAICVGWLDGYDENDNLVIHSTHEPSWAIVAGIKVPSSDYMSTDFEFVNFPYFDNGDIWDTMVSIEPDEDYKYLARYLLEEYYDIVKYLDEHNCYIEDDGEIVSYGDEEH